jgi:hypothetical protein
MARKELHVFLHPWQGVVQVAEKAQALFEHI